MEAGWSLEFGTDSNECQYCLGCEGGRAPEVLNSLADTLIRFLGEEYSSIVINTMPKFMKPEFKSYRAAFGPGGILNTRGPEVFGPGGALFGLGEEILGPGGHLAGDDPAFFGPGGPLGGLKGRVWFNFDKDVLYFPYPSEEVGSPLPLTHFTNAHLHKVKRLAARAQTEPDQSLFNFPNVEELFIVSQHKYKPQPSQPTWYQVLFAKAQNMLISIIKQSTDYDAPQTNQINWWTFLDGDISEAEHYSGNGFYYGPWGVPRPDIEEHGSSPMSFWNDLFKKNEEKIECNIQTFFKRRRLLRAPVSVRIGIVVAENDVPLLLKQREEYWAKITKEERELGWQ